MIVNKPKKKKKSISRYSVLLIVMAVIFSAISLKLVYLQIYKNDYYKDRANENATRFIAEKAPRGEILDQKGNVLATNKKTYTLTYTTTEESQKKFYETMSKVLKILDENKEELQDDLLLKIDNGKLYYSYSSSDPDAQQYEKLRFLKDRGMNDEIKNKLFKDQKSDLTDDQVAEIDQKLLQVTPEEAFYYLVKSYGLIGLVDRDITKEEEKAYKEMSGKELTDLITKQYSMEDLRDYMVIKDAIKMQSFKGYRSVTIANNINKDTAFIVYQKLNELPGINADSQPIRYYPYHDIGSAAIGYVSPIDSSLKDEYELRGYDLSTDLIGKTGIESAFENELRGVKGGKTVKVNSEGRVTEELFKLQSYPGNSVHLTIDKNIQYAMQKSLEDTIKGIKDKGPDSNGYRYQNATRGAALAIEVSTGRILGMASYPYYDPNLFAIPGQLTKEQTEQYFSPNLEKFGEEVIKRTGLTGKKTVDDLFPKDPKTGYREDKYDLYPKPFYNYATLGLLAPGSIFKPLTAVAGLETGVIDPTTPINATGKFNIHNNDTFGPGFGPVCWIYPGSHGYTDVKKALEVSCNFYFYETAYRLYKKNGSDISALNSIAEYAWKFGLGHDPNSKGNPSTGVEIEENTLGQTYNFDTMKKNIISTYTYYLNDYLTSGNYNGKYKFVPFDYSYNSDDSEGLANAKKELKDKISARLQLVGTGKPASKQDDFAVSILPNVKYIIENSDVYKANVKEYEAKNNTKVDNNQQASIVANAIAAFTVSDKAAEMTSPAQLIYAAIGQGINQYTPLQLGAYISTLANGGTRYKLHLVDEVTDPNGKVLEKFEPEVLEKTELKKSTLDAVKEGMRRANDEEAGTASGVFINYPIPTAGKTGTADYSNTQREYGRSPFATYVSFAPVDKPEIAFVGVIYDGGHGAYTAPVARATYDAYFKEKLLKEHPEYTKSSPTFKKYVTDAPKDNYPGSENELKKDKQDDLKDNKNKEENTKANNQ